MKGEYNKMQEESEEILAHIFQFNTDTEIK